MTFMAWISAETWEGVRQIVGKSVHGGCGGRTQYGIFSENSALVFRLESAGGRANMTTVLPELNVWTHIAATNDGSIATLFVNGEEAVSTAVPGELNFNDDPLRIAQDCDRPNYIFQGIVDEARLWNRALTEAEINDYIDLGAEEILAVDPQGKAATSWGALKSR